jgi:hypothetical protein
LRWFLLCSFCIYDFNSIWYVIIRIIIFCCWKIFDFRHGLILFSYLTKIWFFNLFVRVNNTIHNIISFTPSTLYCQIIFNLILFFQFFYQNAFFISYLFLLYNLFFGAYITFDSRLSWFIITYINIKLKILISTFILAVWITLCRYWFPACFVFALIYLFFVFINDCPATLCISHCV